MKIANEDEQNAALKGPTDEAGRKVCVVLIQRNELGRPVTSTRYEQIANLESGQHSSFMHAYPMQESDPFRLVCGA
jgi:hypothetical protein